MNYRTCAAPWQFSENSARRATAREEGKRKTEENAIELVIEDNRRKYELQSTKMAQDRLHWHQWKWKPDHIRENTTERQILQQKSKLTFCWQLVSYNKVNDFNDQYMPNLKSFQQWQLHFKTYLILYCVIKKWINYYSGNYGKQTDMNNWSTCYRKRITQIKLNFLSYLI